MKPEELQKVQKEGEVVYELFMKMINELESKGVDTDKALEVHFMTIGHSIVDRNGVKYFAALVALILEQASKEEKERRNIRKDDKDRH